MLMKNKFSKFINLQGKYLTSLLILLTMGIGQMWGDVTATATPAGTYAIGNSKPGGADRFLAIQSGSVYQLRKSNSSYGDAGMKLKGNDNAVIVYLGSAMNLTATCTLNKDNKGEDASFTVYTIAKASFDAIIAQENLYPSDGSSRTVSISTTGTQTSFTVSIANNVKKGTFTGSPSAALPAGYYYIVGSTNADGNGNVYFTNIILASAASGYSVTYEENGHGANQTDLTNQSALPDPLPTLSESGWTFGGWYLDNNTFNTAATAGATISQNTTLYAKWTAEPSAEVCPSGLTIDGAQAYTEGDNIELTAGLSAGNGTIVYQWYKGSIAAGNEVGTNSNVLTINSCSTSDAGNYYCVASKDGCSDVESTAYAVAVAEVTKYMVTLIPAGGTISDATGWTLNGGNYEKEVAAGTELALPTFTKENRTFKTWRNAIPADVASPVTVNSDMTLTAVWNATVESVLYSWESPAGTAIETGGTAITKDANGNTVDGNTNVNATLSNVTVAYKAIMLNGKISSNAWSGNYVQITTTEAVKTGDKVKVTACTTKGDTSKKGSAQMRAGTSATSTAIFTDGNSYNDIYADNTLNPNTKTFTVPDGVNTSTVTMTRSQTSTNCWVTKLQIIREVQVEEANLRTVTFNSNGGSAVAAVEVASGQAVAKPADPTKAHCRFNGWKLNSAAYDFSTAVTSNITLVADWIQLYTITYAKGDNDATGDAPAAVADKAQGETFPVPANTFTAPASKEFDKWNDGTTDYAPGDTYTVGTANVVLTAQWKALVAKYTVIFKDGDVTLDTKLFDVGSNPSDAEIDKTKPLFTFAAWQKDEADIALDDAFWATVAKDATVTLNARWAKAYAQDADLEGLVEAEGTSADWQAYLSGKGYAYSTSNVTLDAKASGKSYENWPYQGLKAKEVGAYVEGRIAADKLVILKLGHMAAAANVTIGGVAAGTATGLDAAEPAGKLNYFYAENEAILRYETTNAGACVLKAITIQNPYQVSFDENGGDNPVAAQYGTPSVTLPSATKGTESFLGWFIGEDKIGDAGDSYIPTANVELVAHWEAISTDNTLSDLKVGGVTVDGFSPTVHTYYVVLPYGTAVGDIPVISATANSAKAKQVAIQQAVWTGDPYNCYRAQANVQAEDESWGYYDVRFSFAPKDGVSIIKVATTGGSNKTVTGLYAGDGDVNLSSNTKMDNGKYIGFTLAGTTLQAGDRINVHTTEAANTGGSHIIFYDNMTDKNELYETGEIGGTGNNIFTINAAMVGHATAYVYRANNDAAHQWNGKVNFIEVTRAMNPVLTAITFDGVDGEQGVGNTFSATLPNGTVLADMTVVPTIVKNGEGGSAAPTAAWAWGANTYRVTDKDGDYTDYTITLTEAAAPSAAPVITAQPVGANYLEGAAIAALEVVATGEALTYQWYLGANAIDGATAATYTPAVSAIGTYVYHCVVTNTEAGHPATSLASDNATITIAEDPAAIKLLDGEGNINTTDFITAVSKNTVNYGGADHNCATFGSTASTAVGASGLNKFIIYNAKTDQTKIKFVLYNTQSGAVTMKLQKLVEGGTEMEEVEIEVPSKQEYTTDFYAFDGSANRTMYAFVQNTGIKVLQVKVIDNGTALKQFGEVGYSINFNQGRLFLYSGADGAYDGMTYRASSNYAPLTNEGLSITKSRAYGFSVPADVTMTVTAANNAKYYITQSTTGTDNETAVADARSFDLTAGTWYLRVDGSNLSVTNIAFAAPKCAEPVIDNDPVSNTNFGQGNLTASVTAHTTDGATLAYQWYDADDNEVAGANAATLTTTTPGTYYVIVTGSKAGYENRSVQSANATLAYRDLTIATLSALSQGGNEITLQDGVYEYNVYLPEGTTDVPALAATATQATYGATAVPTDAAEFISYEAISTVLVTAEDGTTTQTYTVHFYVDHIYSELVPVTASTTWNWTGASTEDNVLINDVPNKGLIIANYLDGANFEKIEGKEGERAYRNQNYGCYQGTQLHFNTTVPGKVKFYFRAPSGGENCTIYVNNNGKRIKVGTRGNSMGWSKEVVVKGDVVIEMENDKAGGGDTRVQQIVFTQVAPDYTRNVSNNIGTLCVDHNVLAGGFVGATFYQIAGRNQEYSYKIDFEEVGADEELVAGEPYIFQSTTGRIDLFYGETVATQPVEVKGMHGTFSTFNLPITEENKLDVMYISNNKLWNCGDLVGTGLNVVENRAYIVMSEVPEQTSSSAPGRRRITLVTNAEQVATGVDTLNASETPVKVMINGQIFIIRGEKMFDVTGKLVK